MKVRFLNESNVSTNFDDLVKIVKVLDNNRNFISYLCRMKPNTFMSNEHTFWFYNENESDSILCVSGETYIQGGYRLWVRVFGVIDPKNVTYFDEILFLGNATVYKKSKEITLSKMKSAILSLSKIKDIKKFLKHAKSLGFEESSSMYAFKRNRGLE